MIHSAISVYAKAVMQPKYSFRHADECGSALSGLCLIAALMFQIIFDSALKVLNVLNELLNGILYKYITTQPVSGPTCSVK
jgi:hypothetical protein